MGKIAKTPTPPYYAVIFTSERTEGDAGYGEVADKMVESASKIDGFLGVESLRDDSGFGMTVSYWKTLESIEHWKQHQGHMNAKISGKKLWYSEYKLRICKVEMDNHFASEI